MYGWVWPYLMVGFGWQGFTEVDTVYSRLICRWPVMLRKALLEKPVEKFYLKSIVGK